MKSKIVMGVLALSCLVSNSSRAQNAQAGGSKAKIFMTTATYGVMAGSLVGLASLTFYRQPSKRIRNVAIGASLGLYTGILLGAYMIYFVPDPSKPNQPEAAPPPPQQQTPSLDSDDPLNLGGEGGQSSLERPALSDQGYASLQLPPLSPVANYDGRHLYLGLDYKF